MALSRKVDACSSTAPQVPRQSRSLHPSSSQHQLAKQVTHVHRQQLSRWRQPQRSGRHPTDGSNKHTHMPGCLAAVGAKHLRRERRTRTGYRLGWAAASEAARADRARCRWRRRTSCRGPCAEKRSAAVSARLGTWPCAAGDTESLRYSWLSLLHWLHRSPCSRGLLVSQTVEALPAAPTGLWCDSLTVALSLSHAALPPGLQVCSQPCERIAAAKGQKECEGAWLACT